MRRLHTQKVPDGVVAVQHGKFDDVVHGDVGPGSEMDVKRLEESKWLVSWGFDPAALVARLDIRAHVPSDARPRVIALD